MEGYCCGAPPISFLGHFFPVFLFLFDIETVDFFVGGKIFVNGVSVSVFLSLNQVESFWKRN